MWKSIYVLLFAYLSDSVLYANVFGGLFGVRERYAESADKNPGTANAFTYGGFACGVLTLCFELLKGFAPVFAYLNTAGPTSPYGLTFVIVAPVVGHAFSVFHGFRGGKGIAVSFGALLGLMPTVWIPAVVLAVFFIFFSVVLRIDPHFYRTLVTFLVSAAVMAICPVGLPVFLGFASITAVVILKLHMSSEEREKIKVKLLWMH